MRNPNRSILPNIGRRVLVASVALGFLPPTFLAAQQKFELKNPLSWDRPAANVVIDRESVDLPAGQTITEVRVSGGEFAFPQPFQLDDLDGDGRWDELFFQVPIRADQTLVAHLATGLPEDAPSFDRRVDAIADAAGRNPDVTKPGWESEYMTYVAYGAAQVDAIGKLIPQLSIDFLYRQEGNSQHDFTVEHGQDFLSVGNTMGAHAPFVREPDGTITRPWSTDAYVLSGPLRNDATLTSSVVVDGPLRAIVETRITDWSSALGDYACTIRYSIAASQRHTHVHIAYDEMPEDGGRPVIGAGTRAFREDMYVEESDHKLIVASRDVLERTLLVPWIGRAIVTADSVETEALRIPDGAAPEEVSGSGPNYGLLFPDAGNEVEYAFISSWNFDDAIASWPQYRKAIDRLQQELSSPVRVRPVR